jgi:hypothetical protein
MRRSKRTRVYTAEALIQRALDRLIRQKRKQRWLINQLVFARDQLSVVLSGKIK